ncbi:tyrosine-type recombinase/integrase [Pseudomonas sp. zfem005]|uniref:tyrosine-type recombinase/integrase n=1 Tax=Pseudomonas sp. zfem005 TaxID=3078200 RepID=UPI002929DBB7|nr:integrase arm-type DNA-binding domain-containing protein [Pseudomonas sp. zfem005]MDU9415183.1 integrase arm-type DNA-binding domain-containing protein [Pseudomonas sp. zfem005]
MPLTDVKIRQAKPGDAPIKMTDGGGLVLEVRPNGSKLWRYRYRLAGKENLFAIGSYPEVSLADARAERDMARVHVKAGRHPSHVRQTEKALQLAENRNTFKAVADEWIQQRLSKRTERYRDQISRAFESNVYSYIGRLPMREITAAHVLDVMRRMDERGASVYALQVRQWISAVFCFGVVTLRADADPAAAVRGAVERGEINHSRPMSREQLGIYMDAVKRYKGFRVTVIALQLLPLLFTRTVELRAARWPEFDLDNALWTVPAARMKKRRIHLVPLPSQALALLRELREITPGDLLFPGLKSPTQPLSPTTLNRAMEYMGLKGWHCHDFRATANTHLEEMKCFRTQVIDIQMARKDKDKTRASYNHAAYLDERRVMMQAWADWILQ